MSERKQQELTIIWRKICALDKEITLEARRCKDSYISDRYKNLSADMAKLRAEYVKNGGETCDPRNVGALEKWGRDRAFGRTMGKEGPDTHATRG
jgi:hypothetical protein